MLFFSKSQYFAKTCFLKRFTHAGKFLPLLTRQLYRCTNVPRAVSSVQHVQKRPADIPITSVESIEGTKSRDAYILAFTCKKCNTRSVKRFSKV
jgi:hypothetical protein